MRKAVGDLPQHTPAFTGHVPKWSGLRACTTLAACGLRLGRLRCLSHLREYFANGFVGPWAALFSPGLQPLDLFFEIREEVWAAEHGDRKSTRLNSSHANISYAVFCLKKKNPAAPGS